MVPCQDTHLAYRLPEPERHEFADAIIGMIPRRRLAHGYQERIPFLFDVLPFRARRDEDFYIHPLMVLYAGRLLHSRGFSAPERFL